MANCLRDIGFTFNFGMGPVPIPPSELREWLKGASFCFEGGEFEAILNASRAYLVGFQEADKKVFPAPFQLELSEEGQEEQERLAEIAFDKAMGV